MLHSARKHIKRSTGARLTWPVQAALHHPYRGFYGISNFVDHDPRFPDRLRDYQLGQRTYDTANGYNHQGVDIFNWPFLWETMASNGVQVVAADDGIILGKDDGHPDQSCSGWTDPNAMWNAVYLLHDDGTTGWYGHMKKGSTTQKPVGSRVQRGETIGIVGSSGISTGPHLHFELYDENDQLLDPFAGPGNTINATSYWLNQPDYLNSSLSAVLTHGAPPVFGCADEEQSNLKDHFDAGEPVIVAVYFRDQVQIPYTVQLLAPNGSVFREWTTELSGVEHYNASYWYWTQSLPATVTGIWSVRVLYDNQTITHSFSYGFTQEDDGDLSTHASLLTLNDVVERTLNRADDVDFFQIDIRDWGLLNLRFEGTMQAELADNHGQFILALGAQQDLLLKPGTYLVSIFGTETSAYRLTTSFRHNLTYVAPHLPDPELGWQSEIWLLGGAHRNGFIETTLVDAAGTIQSTSQDFLVSGLPVVKEGRFGASTWADIQPLANLDGHIRFAFKRSSGSEKTAVPLQLITDAHQHLVFPHIPADRIQFWSGYALVNPQSDDAHIQWTAWGEQGQNLDHLVQGPTILSAHAKVVSLFEGSLFDDQQAEEKIAWLELNSDMPLVGFELFGRHAAFSSGELAGIPAQPLIPSQPSDWALPFALSTFNYQGCSVLNPNDHPINMTLSVYGFDGNLVGSSQLMIGARQKLLGLLLPDRFTFPVQDPVLNLNDGHQVAWLRFQATEPLMVFSLTGDSYAIFDGITPILGKPNLNLVIGPPGLTNKAQVCNLTNQSAEIVCTVQSGDISLWSNFVTLPAFGSVLLDIPSDWEDVTHLHISGPDDSRLSAVLWQMDERDGGSLIGITPANDFQ